MTTKRAEGTAVASTPSDAVGGPSTDDVASGKALPGPSVTVSMLSKTEKTGVEYRGDKGEVLSLGELYLNDLSDLYVFEVTNQEEEQIRIRMRVELRKPFQSSQWSFQLENENISIMRRELEQEKERTVATDEFEHVPFSVLRSSSRAAICAENVYLCEGYNELFNHIGTVKEVTLAPKETTSVILSICTNLTAPQNQTAGTSTYVAATDSSDEERAHLSETSCFVLSGRLVLQPSFVDSTMSSLRSMPAEMMVPLQGQVCRSLLRLDVKELHFDDCVPGGSFVKDFTVWNRSEIPLLFHLSSPMTPWSENKGLLVCTDYNSGYVIGDKTLQAAAYGHVRIRVTYRPTEIGERFFEIQAQNLHDSRNVKTLRIHAITNQEHHREGLSIKKSSGSFLMSGSCLDFGDCYTGIASSKTILMRNMTEVALHVELTSDRPKEVTFELKLQQNGSRVSRAPRADDVASPTTLDDGLSLEESMSPGGAKELPLLLDVDAYGPDSDEEIDDNEGDFYDEDLHTKQSAFDGNPMGDVEDLDDDFEFDREPRALLQSPHGSPEMRATRGDAVRREEAFRMKGEMSTNNTSGDKSGAYDSGRDSRHSSPERNKSRKHQSVLIDEKNASNFLVETIDLPPGVERTILIWYSPASFNYLDGLNGEKADAVDLKAARLTKQTFRVSFRCFLMEGAWQQAQSRVYDRALGKSIHVRARTCTSLVTVTPSVLHLGDCYIGELKSSSCMLTNHSELPTVVKPLVTSKVISTVPNDDVVLGPKQSVEVKIEIVPRKTNSNYSRLISILNTRNQSNIPQICVRSSNMDAHHVIYHSLFYKLLTQSRFAFLNFDHVAVNSVGIQVFDLENITNAPLHLHISSSAPSKIRLYCIKHTFADRVNPVEFVEDDGARDAGGKVCLSSTSTNSQTSGAASPDNVLAQRSQSSVGRTFRRRRSFCSMSELVDGKTSRRRGKPTALRDLRAKKLTASSALQSHHAPAAMPAKYSISRSTSSIFDGGKGRQVQHLSGVDRRGKTPQGAAGEEKTLDGSSDMSSSALVDSHEDKTSSEEVAGLLELFAKSRADCDAYCYSSPPSKEKEKDIVAIVRERTKRLQTLLAEKKLVLLNSNKERNVRVPAKSRLRIVSVFSPVASETADMKDVAKTRVERHKILITLPPGGNRAVAERPTFDHSEVSEWTKLKHSFDLRPSVRELLLKSRVCRSVMNVNQKNINFGRISTSSKNSKRLVVQNMSATPLVYSVEKTGSISSGFLQIKEGEVGVVKAFGTKEICFQFQPTLAGPFEEKLKIVNAQDAENSVSVTIKARVVKCETFKLLQSGQTISFGKCVVGEKTEKVKIALRNTSRKKREYVIQVDQSFTVPTLRPTFYFSIDETPATVITQAQEKKLDEELEKLEHKLRIAETKKKVDKIVKLNIKISQVKALLSGEQIPINSDGESMGRSEESSEVGACDPYDSANSESELSELESSSRSQRRRSRHSDKHFVDVKTGVLSRTNTLHFSLEAEATGKVVAYAIFNPIKSGDNSLASGEDGNKREARQRKEMKKRQLRRDATTIVGMGKFLLFEQQNKDVVKELQYNAEIFLRTPAGENAFCRAVGRKPPSTLPPHPHNGTGVSIMDENILKSRTGKPRDVNGGSVSQVDDISSSMAASVETKSAVSKRRHSLTIEIPDSGKMVQKLNIDIASSQCCPFPTSSSLLVLAEESPSGTRGWPVTLTLGSPSFQGSAVIEIAWNPASTFKNVMTLTCNTVLPNFLAQDDKAAIVDEAETRGRQLLPVKLNIPVDRTVSLDLKWCFTSDAGFAPSTPLASCVSRSVLESVSEAAELNAGTIDFFYCSRKSSPQERHQSTTTRTRISSLNVVVVKTAQRSLCFEDETIDLGECQQGEDIRGEVVIHNRLQQALQYLLLAGSRDPSSSSIPSSVSPLLVGGELTFENATGTVPAESFVRATFLYKGSVPGQHKEQIVLRNLSGDRLDTSVLTLSVRIVRPVYVRIPELDPQVTGQLEVLDLGPCYVTPEMQDTAVDSPNGSFRFSKVHKLTLHSQVEHTLVVCASSNLKTQCYVYEDAHLQREATHVVMKGMHVIDLYVAIRPRLSSDAIKTGSTRELVGGIRVQLFGLLAQDDTLGDEKSDMLTEFTVKFVGVAGASIARIAPPLIDFGVEYNGGRMQTCQTHEGHFELVNMSKALPLKYRLYVTNATEGYSDDDDSLHLSLKHEKGEIPANETGKIEFRMMAYTNGLFRRRIMVDNINYPGKAHSVDVLLFVDSGALSCEVAVSEIDGHLRQEKNTPASRNALSKPVLVQSVDLGRINVIRLEEELSDTTRVSGDSDPSSCKYRIYGKSDDVPFIKARSTANSLLRLPGEKTLVLTNTTDRRIVVRPFSTLPMTFRWKQKGDDDFSASEKVNTRFASMEDARRLCVPRLGSDTASQKTQQSSVFYGDSSSLDANSTVQLSFRFAPIAVTVPLPIETIESGQLCPFRGMIGIQSFETGESEDGEEACTLKVVNVSGLYGEPRFHIAQKHIALGKIGYAIGWKSSTFMISVKNVSDMAVSFILANLPACIHVCNVRDARRIEFDDGIDIKAIQRFPSLRMLALHAEQLLENDEHGVSWTAWGLQPRTTCVLEMELVRTKEFLIAGNHEFLLRFFNLCNPSNRENVLVQAQIISSYAELVIDSASADKGMETADSKEDHVAFLPPVTVPASLEAPLHRASFWFSLRNVYDEELSVRLSSQTHSPFDRTIELLLMLRSAHTPLSSIVISPGESVDIRVVCHVFPAARLLPDTWPSGISGATSDILDLGRVLLDINIRNAEEAAQQEEIRVKGKFLPGKTFLLSASSLHFFATATDLPAHISASQLPPNLALNAGGRRDSSQTLSTETSQQTTTCVVHQLRNSFESFWVRNPSMVDVLDFAISPVSMYQPGLCLVKGSAETDMCAMSEWIQAIAIPSSGSIAPNESLKITVRLEEATPTSVDPFHDGNDDSTPGKIAPQYTVRRNPTWRSNSWDADALGTLPDEGGSYHMSLIVRDIDSNLDTAVSAEIDVLLVLQQQSSSSDRGNKGNVILDTNLITTALSARNDRLAQPRKLCPRPSLKTHVENEFDGQLESPGLDNACKFNVSSSRSGVVEQNDYLPVLVVRGCTPAEYSSLENTRYLIDVGQHTVRNGGEVEWEITIESLFGSVAHDGLDSVEYHLMLVDKAARSWLQLSRERGTLDRAHSYQSIVLYFLRGVVGVYSTFLVLQNLANPSDLKVIHVRLEVIADLNSLRGMSSELDPTRNLFRVLVSNHGNPKRPRRSNIDMPSEKSSTPGGARRLTIDFREIYYYKLYQNHSIVIENSSGLSLDFMLSTNARPQEVSFSISPMSLNEVTTVTLGAHTSMQVFLHFRPQPKQLALPGASDVVDDELNDPWVREIEVYVSCRLVKDFRETVILHAICSQPQLMVNVANGETERPPLHREAYFSAQPTFLGLVFPMLEPILSSSDLSAKAADEMQKFLVVRNTKKDVNARLALRNDSMFFGLAIDESLTQPGTVTVDVLDRDVCAGRKPTLLLTIQPQCVVILRVKPDVTALWKHHQLWDHSVKEHVTLYNINQFAEHYQVTLCFTSSNVASFYIPPNISESYPISALEDIVAKFLQNFEYTWKRLISFREKLLKPLVSPKSSSSPSPASTTPKLSEVLNDLEDALDLASPFSPRDLTHMASRSFEEVTGTRASSRADGFDQLVQLYQALYFDFYYITDELVWYGVRGNAVRHSLALADLAYGVVFDHDIFRSYLADAESDIDSADVVSFPRLLLPWVRQLGHFLSFFPENQEATQPLRQIYDQLRQFETS